MPAAAAVGRQVNLFALSPIHREREGESERERGGENGEWVGEERGSRSTSSLARSSGPARSEMAPLHGVPKPNASDPLHSSPAIATDQFERCFPFQADRRRRRRRRTRLQNDRRLTLPKRVCEERSRGGGTTAAAAAASPPGRCKILSKGGGSLTTKSTPRAAALQQS